MCAMTCMRTANPALHVLRPYLYVGAHDPCRPGQCARTLQPAEQRRAFQLQLQAWLQTPPPRSAWEIAGVIEEVDEEIASATSGEVLSGAARSTW